jgi:HSP20 family protein
MTRTPDDPLENLQREVERLFHDLVYHRHPASHFGEPRWSPPADLVVSADSARVILELAGVPRERVKVTLRGRTLEIAGRRETPTEPTGAHYHRAEIFFGDFRRTVELPWDADPESIDAVYRDGMLEIRLRKSAAAAHTEVRIEESRST